MPRELQFIEANVARLLTAITISKLLEINPHYLFPCVIIDLVLIFRCCERYRSILPVAWHLRCTHHPPGLIAQILMGAGDIVRNLEVLENYVVWQQDWVS